MIMNKILVMALFHELFIEYITTENGNLFLLIKLWSRLFGLLPHGARAGYAFTVLFQFGSAIDWAAVYIVRSRRQKGEADHRRPDSDTNFV